MNYSDKAAKARLKIMEYGSPCLIKRKVGAEYNPETDEYDGEEVIIRGFALQESIGFRNIDGSVVQVGDIVLTATLDGTPEVGDRISFAGTEYVIVNFERLSPDGKTAIYYSLQCR